MISILQNELQPDFEDTDYLEQMPNSLKCTIQEIADFSEKYYFSRVQNVMAENLLGLS
jgi:hypothetical protein